MFTSIKTSEANRQLVSELTNKLGLGPENIVARLAFAYSLSNNTKLDIKHLEDSKGKEYSSKVLFGDYLPFYVALICQRYNLYKNDEKIPKYIKLHIDDGLRLMDKRVKENPNMPLFDFIFTQIEIGLRNL